MDLTPTLLCQCCAVVSRPNELITERSQLLSLVIPPD